MRSKVRVLFALACVMDLLGGCTSPEEPMLGYLSPYETGVDFQNTILESDTFNILNFHYLYNGGGVGIGDFNQDGLVDLVFTGNQVASRIYLNRGDFQFEDITQVSGFTGDGWTTGVSVIDINQDGLLDIYLSTGGIDCTKGCANLLFVNQGLNEAQVPVFEEQASQYNLQDEGHYTQQTAFLDFDLDGDLDAYLLHNVIDRRDKNAPSPKRYLSPLCQDQLLENQNGKFQDVSEAKGILHKGYGLGIRVHDFDQDGYPDIYVANDFLSDDLLYLNQVTPSGKSKGFAECSQKYLQHQSYNSMGVDVADVNQDALADVVVLDMLPASQERQKSMLGFMNYDKFLLSLKENYAPQFVRNTLQVHNGFLRGDMLSFSEVGNLAGISRTDWSWSPLLLDLDNDGDRDLFVTNGYGKDITDLDFVNYSQEVNAFGSAESLRARLYEALSSMPEISLPNYVFENQGNLEFKDQRGAWMEGTQSISNGAAYADLDNDGDLDLVSNNINAPAFIIQNNSPASNYIKIRLVGSPKNRQALGSQIWIWHDGQVQTQYVNPVRGYLSSMQEDIHFGLGSSKQVDSLKVAWPGGGLSLSYQVDAGQRLEFRMADAQRAAFSKKASQTLFQNRSEQTVVFQHQENAYVDFTSQRLLLKQYSRLGPCLAVGNVDGKPGDELLMGGSQGHATGIFFEQEDGPYLPRWLHDSLPEVVDAHFLDVDGDRDLDLYLAHGSNEAALGSEAYQDVIYLNDGAGNFKAHPQALPKMLNSSSCIVAFDYDQDGDEDLFIGSRLTPHRYPKLPRSYLLENEAGVFKDVTPAQLQYVGMLSDAIATDLNQDSWPDLVLIGEWMPINLFLNAKGTLHRLEVPNLEHTSGLWNCIAQGDFDRDGDPDFILGNMGLNSRLAASPQEPMVLYKLDRDQNGSFDPVIGRYFSNSQGKRALYPLHNRDDIMLQIPSLKKQFIRYSDFAQANMQSLLSETLGVQNSWEVHCLASIYLENRGELKWGIRYLPQPCQWAPVQSILVEDLDNDGHLDALMIGNDYTIESNGGWQDAFQGLYLQGDGKGGFIVHKSAQSGFYALGDNRDMALLHNQADEKSIWLGRNAGSLQVFSIHNQKQNNK